MTKIDKNKELDLNEMAITLEVDNALIDEVRSGEVTHLVMQINEGNQNLILENIEGNLVMVTDEMPTTYHGCSFYNGGVFPYAIKSTLNILVLDAGEPGTKPSLSLERLQKEIPSSDWTKGHSGILLSDNMAKRLDKIWEEAE